MENSFFCDLALYIGSQTEISIRIIYLISSSVIIIAKEGRK
jgi:hypothetical protein